MTTAVIYVNRARHEPEHTLRQQLAECEAYAHSEGYDVVEVVTHDQTRGSGWTQSLLAMKLIDHSVDVLLVTEYDRWGEEPGAFLDVLYSGATIVAVRATDGDRHAFGALRESALYFKRRSERRYLERRAKWDPTVSAPATVTP